MAYSLTVKIPSRGRNTPSYDGIVQHCVSEAFKNSIFQAPVQPIPGGFTNIELHKLQVGGNMSCAKKYHINTEIDVDININNNDRGDFLKYIDSSNEYTLSQNFITFNTEGLKNNKNSLEYLQIFKKNAYVFVNDVRLTPDKEVILNELATKNSKLIYMQQNRHNNMSGGTLICIPKQFFMVKPVVVYDDWDRFTLIAYVNEKGRQVLLGSIYI